MIRSDLLSRVTRERGAHLAAAGAERMASALRGRKRSLIYVGTALALAGAGSATAASAATVGGSAAARPALAAASRTTGMTGQAGAAAPRSRRSVSLARCRARVVAAHGVASHGAARAPSPQPPGRLGRRSGERATGRPTRSSRGTACCRSADRLMPVGTSGPQVWMPLSPAQLANANTIVRQALDKRMGVRAAVIAVATAMQESQLLNLGYGDQDSLGLFQQRPSMGWGTAAQITNPAFAADAFLTALQRHQAGNPTWASEPLWANAQAVQRSGLPAGLRQVGGAGSEPGQADRHARAVAPASGWPTPPPRPDRTARRRASPCPGRRHQCPALPEGAGHFCAVSITNLTPSLLPVTRAPPAML